MNPSLDANYEKLAQAIKRKDFARVIALTDVILLQYTLIDETSNTRPCHTPSTMTLRTSFARLSSSTCLPDGPSTCS